VDKRLPPDGDFFALGMNVFEMRSKNQEVRPVVAVGSFDRADEIADA
jgi:hypothetical protein